MNGSKAMCSLVSNDFISTKGLCGFISCLRFIPPGKWKVDSNNATLNLRCAEKPGGSSLAPYFEGILGTFSSLAPHQAPASNCCAFFWVPLSSTSTTPLSNPPRPGPRFRLSNPQPNCQGGNNNCWILVKIVHPSPGVSKKKRFLYTYIILYQSIFKKKNIHTHIPTIPSPKKLLKKLDVFLFQLKPWEILGAQASHGTSTKRRDNF